MIESFTTVAKAETVIKAVEPCAGLEKNVRFATTSKKHQDALRDHVEKELKPAINKAVDAMLNEEGILLKLASWSE